jgi:uncharacterized protein YecE (DUF72 family)
MASAAIRVGTASWTDHEPFYPPEYEKKTMQTQRLTYYARYFDLVEVDSTFYHLVAPRVVQGWIARVSVSDESSARAKPSGLWDAAPPADQVAGRAARDFTFDVKAFGELTWHHRDENKETITPSTDTFARFSAMVQPLRDAGSIGALLFQFPPWFTFGEDQISYFETIREHLPQDTIAVEFRHRSWLEGRHLDETRAALEANRLAYCVVDEPQIGSGSVPPVVMVTDPRYAMVRFHGHNRQMWYGKNLKSSRERFDYLYSRDELAPWAERILRIAEEVASEGQVHAIMNNNGRNYAIVNGFDLQQLLGHPVAGGHEIPAGVAEVRYEREQRE